MQNLKTNTTDMKSDEFSKRLKNRFTFNDSSLNDDPNAYSLLFEKDTSFSEEFTIVKVNFERATLREASKFKKYVDISIAEDNKSLIIDLNQCDFIDSSFFGVLVSALKRMKAMDKKLYLAYSKASGLSIFSLTGLDKIFTVFNTIEEAIKK